MSQGASRRKVLQVLAGGVGGSLAGPVAGQGHDHPSTSAAAGAPRAAAPAFLDVHRLATVASLAEAIVPGSAGAGVASVEDRLLAADTRERQTGFRAALGAIQAESAARFSKPWLALDAEQRGALLTAASSGSPSRPPRYWTPGQPVLAPEPPPSPPTLRDRFDLLKERIATAYYSSEAGMTELGFTGEISRTCELHPRGH
jgi:hypothetical protein